MIILKFRNDFWNEAQYPGLITLLNSMLGQWVYINNTGKRLADITMSEFMNSGKPTVIIVMDTSYTTTTPGFYKFADAATAGPQEANRPDPTSGDLRVWDCYSDDQNIDFIISNQLAKFKDYIGYCDAHSAISDRKIPLG